MLEARELAQHFHRKRYGADAPTLKFTKEQEALLDVLDYLGQMQTQQSKRISSLSGDLA
jgi:hypothetical protein